jgi:hypothetical protein
MFKYALNASSNDTLFSLLIDQYSRDESSMNIFIGNKDFFDNYCIFYSL